MLSICDRKHMACKGESIIWPFYRENLSTPDISQQGTQYQLGCFQHQVTVFVGGLNNEENVL